MSQVINTNIASLNAQRNLTTSQGDLQTSLQRLSSGLRINSAKDDAAGLAISERFTAQIRGQEQAQRNANDGISLAQTAEGALTEIGNLLQRVRELSVQAANDSNSASDRAALDQEVQQAIEEVGRIANSTQFNNQNVIDGSLSNLLFQVGANQGQVIGVEGVDARASELGAQLAESGFVDADDLADIEAFEDIVISGSGFATITVEMADVDNLEDAVRAINEEIRSAEAGSGGEDIAALGLSAALTVDNEGGRGIVVRGAFGDDAGAFAVDFGNVDIGAGLTSGAVELNGTGVTSIAAEQVNLTELDVLTRQNANQTIGVVDGALDQVNSLRADFGAVQNRFESTVSNLGISAENLSASRSRILDADFASETASLTRAQILQQAGTSVLAQANAVPQNVLGLLQ